MKYLPLIFILILTGCATDAERREGTEEMALIAHDFLIFVEDCRLGEGHLYIDSPATERRVQNAPITVWEMKDAACQYDDERHPRKIY